MTMKNDRKLKNIILLETKQPIAINEKQAEVDIMAGKAIPCPAKIWRAHQLQCAYPKITTKTSVIFFRKQLAEAIEKHISKTLHEYNSNGNIKTID